MTDHDDFATFYAATFAPLCAQLYVLKGDIGEAHDIAQAAFIRAAGRWDRLRADEDPVAWVSTTAWEIAVRQRYAPRNQTRPGVPLRVPDELESRWQADLAGLPVPELRAIVLHHLAGLSISEIAGIMQATEGTVRARLAQPARQRGDDLRDALGGLRDAVLPYVMPPGVPTAAKVSRRWILGGAAATGALVAALAFALKLPYSAAPAPHAGADATSLDSVRLSASPRPAPSGRARSDDATNPTPAGPTGAGAGNSESTGGDESPGDGGSTVGGAGADVGPPLSMQEILDGCLRGASVASVFTDGWVSMQWNNHETCHQTPTLVSSGPATSWPRMAPARSTPPSPTSSAMQRQP